MTTQSLIGFGLLPVLLLIAGAVVQSNNVWSKGASPTIAWLCTAIAIALTVVGATSLLCQSAPGQIPRKTARLVWASVVIIAGAGLIVDAWAKHEAAGIGVSIAEWVGFSLLLAVLFEVPRASAAESAD